MKTKTYAVVDQWGGGHIYFVYHTDDRNEALDRAEVRQAQLLSYWQNRNRRGAKPQVSVWKRIK